MPKPFVIYPADRSRALSVVGEKITVLASRDETQGDDLVGLGAVAVKHGLWIGTPGESHE